MLKEAINDLSGKGARRNSFPPRREQIAAIDKTVEYYHSSEDNLSFLWNAKMRFGKTYTSYMLAKRMEAKRILVLTYKPATVAAWHEDLTNHTEFTEFEFMNLGIEERDTAFALDGRKLVVFASFQLMNLNKNNPIFSSVFSQKWDLLIIDEVHYGTSSDLAEETIGRLYFDYRLDLSGTPFKLLHNGSYSESQIYQWSYSDEQKARDNEIISLGIDAARNRGVYYWLSPLRIYTFRPGDSIFSAARLCLDEETGFSANKFFQSEDGKKFVFDSSVIDFLDELSGSRKKIVQSKGKRIGAVFQEIQIPVPGKGDVWMALPCTDNPWLMSHTFWYLPDVNSCLAMKKLLEEHHFFKAFGIVCAAGDNDGEGADTLALVESAIAAANSKHEQKRGTITLSCGKLNTGVTVPEWSAVLMLSDLESSETYFQTIFRAQSPWSCLDHSNTTKAGKEHCFVFDFNPNRVLKHIYEEAVSKAVNYAGGGDIRKEISDTLSILNVYCCEDGELGRINENDDIDSIVANGTMRSLLAKKFVSEKMLGNAWNVDDEDVREILSKIEEGEESVDGTITISSTPGLKSGTGSQTMNDNDGENRPLKGSGGDKNDSKWKERKEKLKALCGKIPFFIYLSLSKPKFIQEIIHCSEGSLFSRCCGISQSKLNPDCPLAIFRDFEASCERSPWRWGEAGSNGYH